MMGKRGLSLLFAVVVALALAGVASNVISQHSIEMQVQRHCESSVVQIGRLWHLPMTTVRTLPRSSIRMRTDVTAEGKRVTFQVPPNEKPPFVYAHATQVAPFILRVQYGWAAT